MKHEIDVATRAVVRGIITTIRTRHNVSRKDAEDYFRRALNGHSAVIDALIDEVDEDIREQKEAELDMQSP